jgi:AcrR family transcriptional regulator
VNAAAEPSLPRSRRTAILDAAMRVFSRYGFKKTSMDDLARAAGLSRQGLYLHFATKEALFKEAVVYTIEAMRGAARSALAGEKLSVEERLLGAFEAVHAHAIGQAGAAHVNELLDAAAALVGPVVDELEQELASEIVRLLRVSGVAARWKDAGVSAKDLASTLYSTSLGLKHSLTSPAAYRDRMRVAVQIACRGGAKR